MTTLPLHLKGLDDPNPWPLEQKVFDILNEYLQPSSTTSPTTAAQQLDQLTPMKQANPDPPRKQSPEGFMWEIWEYFIEISKQIPHEHPSQDRLVAVIVALTELPPTTVQIWKNETRIWTNLPILGPSMREAWISPTYNNKIPTAEKAAEWINLNSFAARLVRTGTVKWLNFPVWGLRAALEEPSSQGIRLDCDVIAAAEWIIHGGEYLFENLGSELNIEAGSLYKGEATVCMKRWEYWKRRFGEVEGQLGDVAKMAVKRARDRMEEIGRI